MKNNSCIGNAWRNANTVTHLYEVADSAAETDSEEFSCPSRVDFPALINRVSPKASGGMDWKNFISDEYLLC